jgi:hypothetical protein
MNNEQTNPDAATMALYGKLDLIQAKVKALEETLISPACGPWRQPDAPYKVDRYGDHWRLLVLVYLEWKPFGSVTVDQRVALAGGIKEFFAAYCEWKAQRIAQLDEALNRALRTL